MAGTSSIKKIVDFIWGEQDDSQEDYEDNVYNADYKVENDDDKK